MRSYILAEQRRLSASRHAGVNNLPRVVTQPRPDREVNLAIS